MNDPSIFSGLDPETIRESLNAIGNVSAREISLLMDFLWGEWEELDDWLNKRGHPAIRDGQYMTLLQRVQELYEEEKD